MISTNTTPKPMDQNPEMKAVVSGSAADILKAMLKERQGRQEGELFDCINKPTYTQEQISFAGRP